VASREHDCVARAYQANFEATTAVARLFQQVGFVEMKPPAKKSLPFTFVTLRCSVPVSTRFSTEPLKYHRAALSRIMTPPIRTLFPATRRHARPVSKLRTRVNSPFQHENEILTRIATQLATTSASS
jgi:hypothetical protein